MNPRAILLTALLACGPKEPPAAAADGSAQEVARAAIDAAIGSAPAVPAPPAFTPPIPETWELPSGAGVWLLTREDLPLVSIRLVVGGGSGADHTSRAGLTSLTDDLLTRGAGERDASAFAETAERLAIDLSSSTSSSSTWLTVETHADRLEDALDLLADAVLRPRFDPDEVDRAVEQKLGDIAQDLDDPRSVGRDVADRLFWGPRHPYGHPGLGTEDTLQRIARTDVVASWKSRYAPKNATFVVAGAVDRATLDAALESRFGDWKRKPTLRPAITAPAAAGQDGPRMVFVDNPGSAQTVLRVQLPGPAAGDDSDVPTSLGVTVLGGTFTSRLNRLLREEKGYTYGARAWTDAMAGTGTLGASTAVQGEATAPALVDLLNELQRIAAGVDTDELEKARGAHRTDVIESMETRDGIGQTFAVAVDQGRGPGSVGADLVRAATATEADVDAALASVSLQHAVVVVVGDLAVIRQPVEAAVPGTWTVVDRGWAP